MTQLIIDRDTGELFISLKLDNRVEEIKPWHSEAEDVYYFFLPSCVHDRRLYFDNIAEDDLYLDHNVISRFGSLQWEQNQIYTIEIGNMSYQVTFMRSEQIPSLFIETESGSLEALHADKEHEETGTLTVVADNGHVQYSGSLDKISGRGNTTWEYVYKKPYAIKLKEAYPLCGLDTNRSWDLLALYYEQDKIHSKIIYDMARKIGLDSTPQCTWVDLYCAGEYRGLYLLTEDLAGDYKNVRGGVLIEREGADRLEESEKYFKTEVGEFIFKFREPGCPNEEQLNTTSRFIQNIEDSVISDNGNYKKCIDIKSLARAYLIDKITINIDAYRFSTFYYIDNDKLYAGPMWDYDLAMGEIVPDYELPIASIPSEMALWYNVFYDDSDFYDEMVSAYKELIPYLTWVLQEGIDEYAELISASVAMDSVLMNATDRTDYSVSYAKWESYIKYLKFFLANRLNYLNDLWEINTESYDIPDSTGQYHTVVYILENGDEIGEQKILDGEGIGTLPELDPELYQGWFFQSMSKRYNYKIPIYEDIALYAKPLKK